MKTRRTVSNSQKDTGREKQQVDSEKLLAFENIWSKAIQEAQKHDQHSKSRIHNCLPTSNSSKKPASSDMTVNESNQHASKSSSITRSLLNHISKAFLDLTQTNYTAFLVNLLWHGSAVYYLIFRPRKALLTNAVVYGGKNGVPYFVIDTVKFLGGTHAAWALLSLLSFKIKDLTAQKAILLAFTLANFSHLYFNVAALATGRWRIWFAKITAGTSLVTLVNLACYLASVKKNGRYL
ncbi:hypothetical protein K7432_007542 [Basidiobolus ranarum]|uniref:Uncharacterized protein n=1 Tax=Basidiobolus ranarum TaxID=34480 RepID=A0ABR2WT67_9FUNG